MALHWERLGRAGVAIGAGGKADARSLRKQTTACTASAADDLHRGSSTLSARATQRLVPSINALINADRRPHAPSGTDAASDSRNADHLHTPSLIAGTTAGPTLARSLLGLQSASAEVFGRQATGGAPRRRRVKRRTRSSPQRVRSLPRRSRRPSVRLRPVWHHSTRTPLPCVPQALHRSGRSTHRCSSQCIPPLLARAARPHPAHCQCCACCALSQEAPP